MSTDSKPVNSVTRAVDILRLMASETSPLGVTAIARKLNQNPSSCLNVLRSLCSEELLTFDTKTKNYRLNSNVLEIARPFINAPNAFEMLRPTLNEFASTHSVTCALWQLSSDEKFTLLGNVESGSETRISLKVGQRIPILTGAIGRCAAVHQEYDKTELERRYKKIRWQRAPSFTAYYRSVQFTKKRGWASDQGQFIRGMTTVSAPILQPDDKPCLYISNALLFGQLDEQQINQLGEAALQLAKKASHLLYGGS